MNKVNMRIYPVILLLALLSSCGFHLRNTDSHNLPRAITLTDSTHDSIFAERVKIFFLDKGIQINQTSSKAFSIHLANLNFKKNLLSIASSSGPSQYELIGTLKTVINHKEKIFTTYSIYTENANTLLGSENELNAFKQQMQSRLISQLSSYISQHQ